MGTLEFKDDVRSPNISPRESLGLWHGYDVMKIDTFSQLVVYMIWSLLEFGRGLILSSDEVMVGMFMRVHDFLHYSILHLLLGTRLRQFTRVTKVARVSVYRTVQNTYEFPMKHTLK